MLPQRCRGLGPKFSVHQLCWVIQGGGQVGRPPSEAPETNREAPTGGGTQAPPAPDPAPAPPALSVGSTPAAAPSPAAGEGEAAEAEAMVGLEQRLSAVVAVVVGGGAAGLGYRAVTHPLENIVAYQHRGEPLPDKSRISDELLSRQTQMPNRDRKCAPGILLAWSWPHGPFLCLTGAAGKSGQEGTGGPPPVPPLVSGPGPSPRHQQPISLVGFFRAVPRRQWAPLLVRGFRTAMRGILTPAILGFVLLEALD